MSLSPGKRLGPYEVLSKIGEGGMGEVYRGTDTSLGRQVAIKILPEAFAADAERVARFEREARTLASLNHPNIAAIYAVERTAGLHALVMELVEGEDLSQRIARGALPVDEALPIARQMAEALEAAHEQGIIHRDLKPANIKVRPDGTVKVLDFGLAKAMDPAGGVAVGVSQAPTITTPAMMPFDYRSGQPEHGRGLTGVGMILGTAAYMSPEQARGKVVDKRADIWAFGCVLYEMLTGERLFKGEDVGEVMAAVIKDQPQLHRVPKRVQPLLRRCLEKDPRKRLRDIGDLALLLDSPLPQTVVPSATSWLWPAAAVVLLAVASGLAFVHFREAQPIEQSLRFQVPAPGSGVAQMFTLSPDGKHLAFVASADGPERLWVRAMDSLDSRALVGTDGASFPFWAPDGEFLAFFAQGKLKKVALAGGPTQTLADAANPRGGTWSRDGVILFSAGPNSPILRVPSGGGEAAAVTTFAGGGVNEGHRYPAFLPDGTHFLYNAGSDKPEATGVFLGSLDGAAPMRLLPDVTNGQYAPPLVSGGSGFLLFRREGTLMAQPFDASELRTTGDVFPIAERVTLGSPLNTFGAFSVAANGTLAYRTGGTGAGRELVWLDRSGKALGPVTKPAALANAYALSPDERTVAVGISAGIGSNNTDLWLQDLTRGVLTRFTFRPGNNRMPVWSPDSQRLAYSLQSAGGYSYELFLKAASGGNSEESLLRTSSATVTTDWSSDGQFLVYHQQEGNPAFDLWLLPLGGERKPVLYLRTPANEQEAQFAPATTGGPKWMAYQSNESNLNQIYIQAIPASGAKYQVSTMGGTIPRWRRDGRELYYLSIDQKLMAVPITLGTSVQVGTPQELFANSAMTSFVPSRNGQRFLVNVPVGGEPAAAPITVVTNWQGAFGK